MAKYKLNKKFEMTNLDTNETLSFCNLREIAENLGITYWEILCIYKGEYDKEKSCKRKKERYSHIKIVKI